MKTLTGESLLKQLQAMTPEQRKFPIVLEAHDVGRFRETINTSAQKIALVSVDEKGHEEDDDMPPNSIQIS